MRKILFNQAIATIRGELVQKGDGLALESEHGLINLELARGRLLPLVAGTCVVLSGYPRFNTKSGKVQSLAVTSMSVLRSPGSLTLSGRIFAVGDGQLVIQVNPKLMDAFFVPVQGYLRDSKEGEIWRLECLLEQGSATLIDGEKLKNAYAAPTLKRKRKHSKKQQVAA
ncbi:hypothetical protein [Tolypothrix sp. VBCCA 56010]|uniref:hypothetical protein n=1 Tax=Tolypothrix sp. VBCCA 56010 TaxID=3137731 RepID=UPI003D7C9B07